MPTRDEFLDQEADKQAALDELVDSLAPEMTDRIAVLLVDERERDVALWAFRGVPIGETAEDYAAVGVRLRDAQWMAGFQSMLAVATEQAQIEARLHLKAIEIGAEYGAVLQSMAERMPPQDLVTAAAQGIGKDRIKAKRDERRGRV